MSGSDKGMMEPSLVRTRLRAGGVYLAVWIAVALLVGAALLAKDALGAAANAESPEGPAVGMFGGDPSRNMTSDETGLPATWDTEAGTNVLWMQPLGSQAYGGPVVAGGRIFAGTNNEGLRNPKLTGDRGNLMAFDAETGEFLWQSAHEKLPSGRVNDWPLQGVCSGPAVEGDRLWYVSNRAEVIAADVDGFRDGKNDGPVTDEANATEIDEDVLWKLDMIAELDVFPHNLAAGNPLIVGDLLFTVTGNGVDEGHVNIPAPLAPSFIAVDKNTGELVWEDDSPAGKILHGQWSNPAYGVIGGKPQVIFPGGDGWIYSLVPETGELIWKFDCNPKDSKWELGGAGTRNNLIATPVIWDGKVYIGVGQDPEHGEGPGNLWAIDPGTGTGDVTATAKTWNRGGGDFGRTISTVAITDDGLLFAADLAGRLYALDARTGQHYWTYDAFAAIWGSPWVADGKVYIGDEDGDVAVLEASKEMKLLGEINMGAAVYTTPVAADGVMYIMSRNALWALKEGATWQKPADDAEPDAPEGTGDGGGAAAARPAHGHGHSHGAHGPSHGEPPADETPAAEPSSRDHRPAPGRVPELPGRPAAAAEEPAR